MIMENYHSPLDRYTHFLNRFVSSVKHDIFLAINQVVEEEIKLVEIGIPTVGAGYRSVIDFLPTVPKDPGCFNEFVNAWIVLEWGRSEPAVFDFSKGVHEPHDFYFDCHVGKSFNRRLRVGRVFVDSKLTTFDLVISHVAKRLTNDIKIHFCNYIELIFCLYIKGSHKYQSPSTIMRYVTEELRKNRLSYQNALVTQTTIRPYEQEATRILNQYPDQYEYGLYHE